MLEIYVVDQVWQLALVYEVRKETFVVGQGIPIEVEFDEKTGKTYQYVLLAEKGNGIGTARINTTHSDFAKIERVAIVPKFQFQGYGRKLIEAVEEVIRTQGYEKIVITSQVQARGFYERLGYQVNERIKLESSIPTIYTEKNLKKIGAH